MVGGESSHIVLEAGKDAQEILNSHGGKNELLVVYQI